MESGKILPEESDMKEDLGDEIGEPKVIETGVELKEFGEHSLLEPAVELCFTSSSSM